MLFRVCKRFTRGCFRFSQDKIPPTEIQSNASPIDLTYEESQQEIDLKMQQQMLARMHELEKIHQKTQEMIDKELKFPLKLCGTKDTYSEKFAYLPDRVMSYYRIPTARITDYLLKMFKASLYAIADRNTQYMDEYWEQGLKSQVIKAIDMAKDKSYTLKVEKDLNFLEDIPETCEIIDSIMLRGLSVNRNQNKDKKEYIKYSEHHQVGLITYTPKHITSDNQNFSDPKKNKNVYDGYEKMLLRVLVRIKSPLRLNIPEFDVPEEVYTWEHLCVMENQMVAPEFLKSSYKLETLIEWMGKYRFGPWRVVDIDNFMKGNSPFRNHEKEEQLDPVFKGTKLDKSHYIDIRNI